MCIKIELDSFNDSNVTIYIDEFLIFSFQFLTRYFGVSIV